MAFEKTEGSRGIKYVLFFKLMDYGYKKLLWCEEQAESNATEKPADSMWIMIMICTVLMGPWGDRKDLCARIINCKSKVEFTVCIIEP